MMRIHILNSFIVLTKNAAAHQLLAQNYLEIILSTVCNFGDDNCSNSSNNIKKIA